MPIYKAKGKKNGLQKYRVIVSYTDINGEYQQIERVAYGKQEANEVEARLKQDVKDIGVGTQKLTLQELFDEYVKVKQYDLRETTLDKTKRILKGYVLLPWLKKIRIDKLNKRMLQQWKVYIEQSTTKKGEPLSSEYKRKIFSSFRTLLNYAVEMEYLQKSPLKKIKNFKAKSKAKHKENIDFYTSEEFIKYKAAACKAAKDCEKKKNSIAEWNYYVFFMIAFYTGMRKGEIHALKWTDISNNEISVTRSIAQKLKGEDRETEPKNDSSIRTLQIPKPLKDVLDEHKERFQAVAGFTTDWRICGGERCLRDSTVDNRNKSYAEAAKLKRIRIHDFRHSHASLLANNGINIQEIARRLGHSNIEITWNTYSHLYPQEKERALDVLDESVKFFL